MLAFKGRKRQEKLQFFVSIVCMQIFGQNSQLMSGFYCAQLKADFRSGFAVFHCRSREQERNILHKQEGGFGAMKGHCKSSCSSFVLWWHVYLPLLKKEMFLFTLNTYLSHSLPTHVAPRHLSLIYFLLLVFFCSTLLKDAFSCIQEAELWEG